MPNNNMQEHLIASVVIGVTFGGIYVSSYAIPAIISFYETSKQRISHKKYRIEPEPFWQEYKENYKENERLLFL